jgi:drug/metabolite transporter (DMT)-like permease
VDVSPAEKRPMAGVAAAGTGVMLWGALVVLTKLADETNGLVLGFHRIWVGALGTVVVLALFGQRLTWRTLRLSWLGGVLFAADIVLFFSALKLTTVANATIVGAFQPAILLYVGHRHFGEAMTRRLVALTAIAILGAGLVALGSHDASGRWSPVGDLLAIGAVLCWSGYFAASKQARVELGSLEYVAAFLVVATIVITPVALLFGGSLAVEASTWWIILVVALGSGLVGHFLMNWAHNHIPLYLSSLMTLTLPAVAAVSAAIVLGERIVPLQVAGMAVVLIALTAVIVRIDVPTGQTPATTRR